MAYDSSQTSPVHVSDSTIKRANIGPQSTTNFSKDVHYHISHNHYYYGPLSRSQIPDASQLTGFHQGGMPGRSNVFSQKNMPSKEDTSRLSGFGQHRTTARQNVTLPKSTPSKEEIFFADRSRQKTNNALNQRIYQPAYEQHTQPKTLHRTESSTDPLHAFGNLSIPRNNSNGPQRKAQPSFAKQKTVSNVPSSTSPRRHSDKSTVALGSVQAWPNLSQLHRENRAKFIRQGQQHQRLACPALQRDGKFSSSDRNPRSNREDFIVKTREDNYSLTEVMQHRRIKEEQNASRNVTLPPKEYREQKL